MTTVPLLSKSANAPETHGPGVWGKGGWESVWNVLSPWLWWNALMSVGLADFTHLPDGFPTQGGQNPDLGAIG
jgi:hypothetical protein